MYDATAQSVLVGVLTRGLLESRLRFVRQLGATDIFITTPNRGKLTKSLFDGTDALPIGHNAIPSIIDLIANGEHVEDGGR